MRIKNLTFCTSFFLFLTLNYSCKSHEEKVKSLNATKDSRIISQADLAQNFEKYKGEPVIIEGVVSSSCCGQRELPLIDIDEYILDNGDVVSIHLNFKKSELDIVRDYYTGMPIKVAAFAEEMRTNNDFIKEIGAKEYNIKLTDCIILK
jgi:hypothetical protein